MAYIPAIALLVLFSFSTINITPAHALTRSISVAYVTDFSGQTGPAGICDAEGPGVGSSVLVNAVTGLPPAGCTAAGCPAPNVCFYTTGANAQGTIANANKVSFTDISVAAVDAGGVAVLAPFDTVLSYEVCAIGSLANARYMTALNTYLSNGLGKVIILDGDRCVGPRAAIYDGSAGGTAFLFPFTSSNPGPQGFPGKTTFQEAEVLPAVLSRNLPPGTGAGTDAVGDSNTFTSNAGGWCAAIDGKNGLNITGVQAGYARTAKGGLAIWNGFDQFFTTGVGPNFPDAQIFDNMLDQPFNPDSLPCRVPVTGIKLDPLTATNPVGGTHTVTATVSDSLGNPVSGVTVTFTVTAGPNAATTGTGTSPTDASGKATFTYADSGGAGTDTIVATFIDSTGATHTSNTATKIWQTTTGVPEFRSPAMLVAAAGLFAIVLLRKRFQMNLPV
jgi:Bacterial Ig-like domain (group 1)